MPEKTVVVNEKNETWKSCWFSGSFFWFLLTNEVAVAQRLLLGAKW